MWMFFLIYEFSYVAVGVALLDDLLLSVLPPKDTPLGVVEVGVVGAGA